MVLVGTEHLPAFPSGGKSMFGGNASRAATLEDIAFLRRLYWSFRMEEMEPIPWPQDMKRAFIDQQFALQHCHYVSRFPNADFLVLMHEGESIGRLYVDTSIERWHIIDIGFLPQWRNRGKGAATLQAIQRNAKACSASGILLHVERRNVRAQALYHRLRFRETEAGDTHVQMRWAAS